MDAARSKEEIEAKENDEVIELAMNLIDCESLSGYEQPMVEILKSWLENRGWIVQLQEVSPQQSTPNGKARHNIYAHRPDIQISSKGAGPRVLFNSHIDTVPPFISAELCNVGGETVVKGRGACDTKVSTEIVSDGASNYGVFVVFFAFSPMKTLIGWGVKGILAAQLLALQGLVDEGITDVGLLYVVSEETDHSGMIKANDLGLDPEYLVVGEPTNSRMMRLQKGMLKVRLSCRGVACHSGYPHLGKSAVDPLIDTLHTLRHTFWPSSEVLGETTLNIGIIEGGHAANALAETSEAVLMFRLIGDPEEVLEIVEATTEQYGCTVEVISKNSPVSLEVLPGFEVDVAAYNTDIAYFKLKKGRALLYGPGSIHHAHSRTEKIGVKELQDAIEAYQKIAKFCLERT